MSPTGHGAGGRRYTYGDASLTSSGSRGSFFSLVVEPACVVVRAGERYGERFAWSSEACRCCVSLRGSSELNRKRG